MSEFYEFYNNLEIDNGLLVMLMIMSVFVAIFHTIITIGLYEINLKPKGLFFVLNPLLIWQSLLSDNRLGALVAIILFLSVFVLGIIGMIVSAVRSGYQSSKDEDARRRKMGKETLPVWKKILYTLSGLLLFGFVFTLGIPYFIIFVFIILPFLTSLKPNNKKRFYKFQRILPISNICSVAMGLAEISGKVMTIEPMISRIGSKQCIEFLHIIENITTDDDGKDSYTMNILRQSANNFMFRINLDKSKLLQTKLNS